MSELDPSYLRSIRDGILSGNIEANNTQALPDGLVGLYDKELFPPTMKWKERKETLQFFLVFALAQKEISADFAATILGDEWFNLHNDDESKEEKRLLKVSDLIQLHSKRFSSAGGGKYRLYHERFRLYILQKVSPQDIAQFNQRFIKLCETALEITTEKNISEKESYALEFISTHFFISAMEGETECLNKEQAAALKKHAYDQQFWERQIKASKGFEWSKKMLNQMMSVASKFNEDEEVIECALNKVDLYHQEQNDAPRIIQLVADGDIEAALARIEQFGGEDKEGLQRKFTLYMLCLMELTLLNSKEKLHAKSGIERILKHFDEKMPEDHSILKWNDFFPSYLMFQLVCVWHEKGIMNASQNLIGEIETNWIEEMSPYNKMQLHLFELIADLKKSTNLYYDLAIEYVKINEIDKAFLLRNKSNEPEYQDKLLGEIVLQKFIQGNDEIYNSKISEMSNTSIKNTVNDLILIEKAKKNIFFESDIKLLSNDRLPEIAFELIKNDNIVISDKIIQMLDYNIDSNYIVLNFALAKKEITKSYYKEGIDRIILINEKTNLIIRGIETKIEQLQKVQIQSQNFSNHENINLKNREIFFNLLKDKNKGFLVHTILHFFSIQKIALSIELISNFAKNDDKYLNELKGIFEFENNIHSTTDNNVIKINSLYNIDCILLKLDKLYILVKLSKIYFEKGNIDISNILIKNAKEYLEKYFDIKFDFINYITAINFFFEYYSQTLQNNKWLGEFNLLFKKETNNSDKDRKIEILLSQAKSMPILKDEIIKIINQFELIDLSNYFCKIVKIDLNNSFKLFSDTNYKNLNYAFSEKPDDLLNIKSNIALQFLRNNKLNYFLKLEFNSWYILEISNYFRNEGNLDTSIILLKEAFSIQQSKIQPIETFDMGDRETLLFNIYQVSLNFEDISFSKSILKFIEGQFFPFHINNNIERSFNSPELKYQIDKFLFLINELIKFNLDMNVSDYLTLVKNKVNELKIKKINLSKKSKKSEKKHYENFIAILDISWNRINNFELQINDVIIMNNSSNTTEMYSNLDFLNNKTLWDIYKNHHQGFYSDHDLKNIREEIIKYSKLNYDCDLNLIKLSKLNAVNDFVFYHNDNLNFDRYNRTLNLQWAVDIKNQLPN